MRSGEAPRTPRTFQRGAGAECGEGAREQPSTTFQSSLEWGIHCQRWDEAAVSPGPHFSQHPGFRPSTLSPKDTRVKAPAPFFSRTQKSEPPVLTCFRLRTQAPSLDFSRSVSRSLAHSPLFSLTHEPCVPGAETTTFLSLLGVGQTYDGVTVHLAFAPTARNTWPSPQKAKKIVRVSRWPNSLGKVGGRAGAGGPGRVSAH